MTRQQLGSLLPFIFARNEHKQILGRIFEKNDYDQVCEVLNYMNEHALKEDFPLVQDYLTRFKSYRQMPKQSRHLETLFMAAIMVGWMDTDRVFAVSWQLNELLQKGKFTASLRVTVLESGPARETEVTVRNRTADRIQVAFWGQGDTYVEWIPPGDSAVMGEIGFVLPGEYDILVLSTDPSFKPEVSLSQPLKEKTAYSVDISGTK